MIKIKNLTYWDMNNLYGSAMSQNLLACNFKWIKNKSQFKKEDFIKSYDEVSDIGYFIEVDVAHSEKLLELHSDLSFSPKRITILNVEKLARSLDGKKKYVAYLRCLKQALNYGLVLQLNYHQYWN